MNEPATEQHLESLSEEVIAECVVYENNGRVNEASNPFSSPSQGRGVVDMNRVGVE